jgi:hypothetical protein
LIIHISVQQAIICKESNIAAYMFWQVVINSKNKVGTKFPPCGTPESTHDKLEDVVPFKELVIVYFLKSVIQFLSPIP